MTNRTLEFNNAHVLCGYTIAGPKENDGKLHGLFDMPLKNDMFGQDTFEKAERKMFEKAIEGVIEKGGVTEKDVDVIFGGDLLNQIVSIAFAMRSFDVGFLGLYNACATYVEGLILGCCALNNGLKNAISVAGSHFSTAERQYRYPLELGVLRSPVTQWTATGVGATLLTSKKCVSPVINRATIGRVVDFGILDVNNMGAAMAPATWDTLKTHFVNTNTTPADYNLIMTGDLGKLGKEILQDLAYQDGYDLSDNLGDCGASLYYDDQKTYQGGSGPACSALVFNSLLLDNLNKGNMNKLLLVGTGALMSPTTSFQGESIPAIAHLVEVSNVADIS